MSTTPTNSNRRILVVDDNRAIHDDFRKILGATNGHETELAAAEARFLGTEPQRMTFEIDTAVQGADALRLVEQAVVEGRPYAMAFMDFRMPPGWDGVETTRRIWQVCPELQVVICTAYADCSWEEVFKDLNPQDRLLILKKPFDAIEAIQLAGALTEKWRLRRESRSRLDSLETAVAERTRELEASRQAAMNMVDDAVRERQRTESALDELRAQTVERERVKVELREQAARLRLAVASGGVGLWEWQVASGQLTWNDQLKLIFGLPPAATDLTLEKFMAAIHPEDLAETERSFRGALEDHTEFKHEYRILRPDGDVRWIVAIGAGQYDVTGQPVRMLGAALDLTQQKEAEQRLAGSEDRHRALVRSAMDAIITSDERGVIVSWNPAAVQMFGWTEAEAKGQPLLIIIPERFRAAHLDGVQRVQAGSAPRVMGKPVELTGLRKDGSELPIELSLVRWQSGGTSYFGGVIRDISGRRLAETALREKGHLLSESQRIAHIGSWQLDLTGRHIWSDETYRLFGVSPETITLTTEAFLNLLHPGDRPAMQAWITACAAGQSPGELEFRCVWPDGTVHWMSGRGELVCDDAGNSTHLTGTVQEITERKHAEASLHLQSAALEAAANEIVITDRHGRIEWVNPAFTKSTGYTLEEAIGQNPRILKSGKHEPAFYKQLWATILSGEVWRGEMINRKKDQTLHTVDTMITPVKDERGEITHFVAIKQDSSERKLLEAKFLRAQRLEGLGALAGGVAHDLNNVLAPILMASEFLKTQTVDPRTRELLDMIEGNSQRGAGMIRQILAFARGTAGDKVSMQVKHLLKDISRMMKDTFPPSIRTELHMDEPLALVQGEPTELYQVLLNLCVNARDAMPKGGTITVTATNVRLDETYAHLSHEAPPGHYVVLTVADSGCGIPPEIQGKVFDAFFTTKEQGKGTGLGLATVKDIVTGHRGFIHLYSEVGVGTQFKIYLPAVGGEEATDDTTFLKLPIGHGELVLAVDDEAAVREIVKATLEANGYRVIVADDGTQAVARFVEHGQEVQLLLTDIQMPHMDGMATIRALRNLRPDLRVIAASGLTAHQQALKVSGLNVQAFIAKPFTAASLLLALDAALHSPKQADR